MSKVTKKEIRDAVKQMLEDFLGDVDDKRFFKGDMVATVRRLKVIHKASKPGYSTDIVVRLDTFVAETPERGGSDS